MVSSPSFAVVIANYYGYEDTHACLTSLQAVDGKDGMHVVVVNVVDENRASDDGVKLKKEFPFIHLLETSNRGFSASYNAGLSEAMTQWNPEYLVLLNNDTRVDKQLFSELLKFAQEKPGLALYTPKIYFEKGYEFHKAAYTDKERGKVIWYAGGFIDWKNVYAWHRGVDEVDMGQFDTPWETQFASGCCLVLSADTYKKLGKLREEYFLYYEDTDFSVRAKRAGAKLWYVPEARVWHRNSGSSGSGSDLHVYYQTRNRLLFGWRFAPLRTKLALMKEALRMIKAGKPAEREAVRDAFLHRFGRRKVRR